jgi:hypothetical protein
MMTMTLRVRAMELGKEGLKEKVQNPFHID